MSTDQQTEDEPLQPNQECLAVQDFTGQEEGDLPFKTGEKITILHPCELMFWYKARNESGQIGSVPRPFLVPVKEPPPPLTSPPPLTPSSPLTPPPPLTPSSPLTPPPPLTPSSPVTLPPPVTPITPVTPVTPATPPQTTPTGAPPPLLPPKDTLAESGDGYIQMNPTNSVLPGSSTGYLQLSPSTFQQNSADPADQKAFIAQEKEKRRRLKPGTLVMGISPFRGQEEGDLSFNVYEEMMIINPLPDLCWYYAHKADHPEQKGTIPVTHVTLVYMSDDDEDLADVSSPKATHDMLYDDVNDFLSQSGWFSYPGLAHGKVALQHVMAKKCGMSQEEFMAAQRAVYRLTYRKDEKVFVGKANVLHEELNRHFDCFGKRRDEIREVDDELCHHTEMSGWEIKVWVLEPDEVLEVECAKKIIESGALVSKDGSGITEEMTFEERTSFDTFWKWFAPK